MSLLNQIVNNFSYNSLYFEELKEYMRWVQTPTHYLKLILMTKNDSTQSICITFYYKGIYHIGFTKGLTDSSVVAAVSEHGKFCYLTYGEVKNPSRLSIIRRTELVNQKNIAREHGVLNMKLFEN